MATTTFVAVLLGSLFTCLEMVALALFKGASETSFFASHFVAITLIALWFIAVWGRHIKAGAWSFVAVNAIWWLTLWLGGKPFQPGHHAWVPVVASLVAAQVSVTLCKRLSPRTTYPEGLRRCAAQAEKM